MCPDKRILSRLKISETLCNDLPYDSVLHVLDQQFCLDQIRYLYQKYFDLGLQHQIWPVSRVLRDSPESRKIFGTGQYRKKIEVPNFCLVSIFKYIVDFNFF